MPRIPRSHSAGHVHVLNRGNGGAGPRLRRVRDRQQMYVVERVKRGGPTKGACDEEDGRAEVAMGKLVPLKKFDEMQRRVDQLLDK